MTELISHNFEQVETIFQLLGNKENDITRAIAWVLKKCPSFLNEFLNKICGKKIQTDDLIIYYQQFEKTNNENGYTDLEITDEKNIHIILEAKRGWILPGKEQLTKYSHRSSFIDSPAKEKIIVTMSECSQVYAKKYLPIDRTNNGIKIIHYSWKELHDLAKESKISANNEQKHILSEFELYIGGLMTMQNKNSNKVYVVSISNQNIENTQVKWTDIVENGFYFCPMGIKGWPKEPPNYIAFRYNGKLQAIHHIESYNVSKNMHDYIDIMPNTAWDDHFIFNLGPAIKPNKEIRTGKGIYRNGRVWTAIDLLLTCDTITEARDKSKERNN